MLETWASTARHSSPRLRPLEMAEAADMLLAWAGLEIAAHQHHGRTQVARAVRGDRAAKGQGTARDGSPGGAHGAV